MSESIDAEKEPVLNSTTKHSDASPAPSRRSFLLTLGAGGAAAMGMERAFGSGAGQAAGGAGVTRARKARALGTDVIIVVTDDRPELASRAIDAAFAEIDRVESVMSLHRPESELCRLNRDGVLVSPDPRLVEVLTIAAEVSRRSGGAFDVTVQPVLELLARTEFVGGEADACELAAAWEHVDWRKVGVNRACIRFAEPGMAITLNGIGRGYALDRVRVVLAEFGVSNALVNTGERAFVGPNRRTPRRPADDDYCVAVSTGPGIVDPREGEIVPAVLEDTGGQAAGGTRAYRPPGSVTVVARTGAMADALSTAAFVLGRERAQALIAAMPGCDVVFA